MLDKLYKVQNALATVPCSVNHFHAVNKPDQYIIWTEMSEGTSAHGNNQKYDYSIVGTVDYFTKVDMDPNLTLIRVAMMNADISFTLESVQYEEETGYIHYEWGFEVI